jgi:hypothetical protein
MEMEHDFWCPRCDQGWIDRVLLLQSGDEFLLCDECEGVWFGTEPSTIPESTLDELADRLGMALFEMNLRPVREHEE